MRALLDTNILIDYLNGVVLARDELARYSVPLVSLITWMEVLVGARGDKELATLRGFLTRFERVPLDDDVSERTVTLRRAHRIRLPDAAIWASAQSRSAILVTRNKRDFPPDDPGVRIPYDVP